MLTVTEKTASCVSYFRKNWNTLNVLQQIQFI